MILLKNDKLSIIIEGEDSKILVNRLRKSLFVDTMILVESDKFYNNADLPEAISTLIKLQSEIVNDINNDC